MKNRFNLIFFLAVIISGSLFWFGAQTQQKKLALAATVNEGVTVQVNVPTGGGNPGGSTDLLPTIFNVASSTTVTAATVSWSAADDRGISSVAFVYGTTPGYGNTGTVTGNYEAIINSLATNTVYYFKITVVDTGNHTVEHTGNFSTQLAPAPPADVVPPIISNVQVSVGVTTATITWTTNELADTQVQYGLTNTYGSNYFDSTQSLTHTVLLFNLTPGTPYHFQIVATDGAGNSAATSDAIFTTLADTVPPPDVSNFILTTTSNSIVLSWNNPSLVSTPDFTQVRVVRKPESPSANPGDGLMVYTGTAESFTDTNILFNVNYFYTIFSFDTSNNHSAGIFRSGRVTAPATPTEICGNNLDDDNNGRTDCADTACSSLPACAPIVPPTTTPPVLETCRNGVDDDGDALVDFPADPGCESSTDNDEYNSPEPTVPSFLRINLSDVLFFSGNRQISLVPSGGIITGLAGANLTIALPRSIFETEPSRLVLRVGNTDTHQFMYNATDQRYYADVSFGNAGQVQAFIEITYAADQFDSVGFTENILPWGQVVGAENQGLVGTELVLYGVNGEVFPMGFYGQINPVVADVNGNFGWMLPNGNYRLEVHKEGYFDRTINITVTNNVFNSQLTLIAQPPKLIITIDPDATVVENIKNVAGSLAGQTKALSTAAVQKIQDVFTDPEVKEINEKVVAPAAITAIVIGAAPLISWLDFLPFLRLLFLQPLMLLGWRKREKWGLVYNSLNKLPVDLAMVRLISNETGRVIQSKVTDSKGRFIFMVGPGTYRLEVRKNNFVFPSQFLAGFTSDGQKTDIYHGEIIVVQSPSAITAVIPLDPAEAHKKPSRLVWERFGRRLQTVLSIVGIIVTAISLYISPKWYIGVLLAFHIILFFVFRKLAVPPKIRNWGIVYDESTKDPLSRVVARLFNSQFNKLVDTQITDGSGKYYFMAGDAKYYVTYEHKDYHPQKTDIIDLEGKDPEPITQAVNLKKS